MKKILVTRRIPQPALDLFGNMDGVELVVSPHDRPLARQELLDMSQGATAVLSMLVDKIDADYMDRCPDVKIVANFAVGFDNIDLEAARERKVIVANTPDVVTDATADMALALMLGVARRLVEGDQLVRKGEFKGTSPMFMLGVDLKGKTLGIYGMGRIGLAVARRARAFGMNIVYTKRTPDPEAEAELGARYLSFDEFLAASDFVSVNAPLTEQTKGAFNYQAFGKMKKTAYVINTARGPLIKEADLVKALSEGLIAGAGLDVYEKEPLVHQGLLDMPNVLLAPHAGTATWETRCDIGSTAAENIIAYLKGEEIPHRVV
ncbi:2-hydroxyacid dehydrogenase [Dethiosulfatarculus sandiegensis]|uniref:Glyoxylate reductase n=1 Tax=Dethiosulfatarculus sandiegensis TaxID=1429043 RepID=A0A0D2J3P6_9BACT|nr:D-glycerate dehydrogenase [Dethiosulfatarculus sandiegensis]KIX12809.1 glyoxylate reductase [Dethiosulfatarculus sandiegensis]